ncbi:DUF3889 domain-containing protein [Viridibacillus sp. FSL E2-0187]|uniref:DUF3889 domain-containing protein n=1 Tax=Viridibacillus TaxID=496496 RepID=UPI00187B4C7A|nr:DUF3889 domain-containing protein [Viridibacillus sp. JNUCC-6]QOV11605.1 YqzG/YhdC family protein [Viridibacillus sp. JNUCC-6]
MRKTFIALGIFIIANSTSLHIPTNAYAQQEIPAYVKWGKLALIETNSKYPNAKIIDYLHQGRETKKDTTTEKFKLWLKEGNREFGVFVRIEYNTHTEKVLKIELQETSK